ncbi:MAG: ferritin family protein [Ignavibacteria bacterium]|nr:ferritin family protein [Ignavibacteria bacterium]
MADFKNINDILDFAIAREQESVDFYTNLSNKARNEEMKNVFHEFAMEEVKHKARLQKIKDEGIMEISDEKVQDLKISDYTVNITPTPDMSYEEALILAMNKEKAAYKLYMKLSTKTDDPNLREVFLSLAQEESKHKLRFEIEYDEFVLREN